MLMIISFDSKLLGKRLNSVKDESSNFSFCNNFRRRY